MARIRTIKPSFFSSLTVASMPKPTRLTFIGLWTYVDDAGRAVDDPRLVKADIWPLDDDYTARKVDADLKRLAAAGLIERYEIGGRRYLRVVNWGEHQRINRPQRSKLPAPNDHGERTDDSLNNQCDGTDDSPPEGKGREEEGKGTEEPSSSDVLTTPADPPDDDDPPAADPDPLIETALAILAERDLDARQAVDHLEPIGDPVSWANGAADRRRDRQGDELRTLADENPGITPQALADLLEPPRQPTDDARVPPRTTPDGKPFMPGIGAMTGPPELPEHDPDVAPDWSALRGALCHRQDRPIPGDR